MRGLKSMMKVCTFLLAVHFLSGCSASSTKETSSIGGNKLTNTKKVILEAPIESINLVDNTVTLAGVTFKLNDLTVHVNELNDVESASTKTLGNYLVGDLLKVEGVKESDNSFTVEKLISEVDDEDAAGADTAEEVQVEISGPIESIQGATFKVLGHTIALESDAKFIRIADSKTFLAAIKIGSIVQIEGNLVDGVIMADEVELGIDEDDANEPDDSADDLPDNPDEVEVSVGGLIESINGENFTVLGITIGIASDIEFIGVADKATFLSSIVLGTYIKAEGQMVNGILVSDEIQFGKEDVLSIGLGGAVEAINGNSFTILGKTIVIDPDTIFKGVADQKEFLSILTVGLYIEVDGDLKNGVLEVEEVEVFDDESVEDGE